MKIGIDARMYSQSGIGRYIRGLVEYLQKIDKTNEYFLFLHKEDFDLVGTSKNFHKVLANYPWYGISEQAYMPHLLNKYNLDLVHFPHFNVPIFYRRRYVVTIHDLIHQHFRMDRASTHNKILYKVKHVGYQGVLKNALWRSEQIIVPSEFVKSSLMHEWKVKSPKITTTPEAVDQKMVNLAQKMTVKKSLDILEQLGIYLPYIFYIGNAHPHKNLERLIDAFTQLQSKYKQLHLVLSGQDHYFWQRVREYAVKKNLADKIIFTGYVTDEQAVALWKNAVCYACPSLEEGFGIPLLEAMACACPVVSSDRGSLPEVGGDACIYFDPLDVEDMGLKIERLLTSERLRQDLIKRGKERYKEFSWEKLAKQTLEVYTSSI